MPWSRSELTIQASNEFGLDLKVPSAQLLLRNRFIWVVENEVGPIGRWTRRPKTGNFSSKIILATKQDRAIDLSCRACGAGAWALGLDSWWGSPLRSVFTPNLQSWTCHQHLGGLWSQQRLHCSMVLRCVFQFILNEAFYG